MERDDFGRQAYDVDESRAGHGSPTEVQTQLGEAGRSRMPLPVIAGICFSVTAVLFIAVQVLGGFGIISETFFTNLPLQLVILQLGFILLPTLLILFATKQNIKDVLRLNKPRVGEVLISAAIPIILFPAMLGLAFIVILLVGLVFGSTDLSGLDPLMSTNLVVVILCAALLPGICEEVLFRGVVLKGLQKNGVVFGIIMSSVLFGLFHMDPQRFIAQALLGAVAAIAVYRTNSIFCGMTVHFTNNALAFLISGVAASGVETESQTQDIIAILREQADLAQIDFGILCVSFILIMLVAVVFFLALSIPLFLVLFKITKSKVQQFANEKFPIRPAHYWVFVPGLLVIIGMYCLMALYLAG
ncbi:MAG: CPBP family intramembrane metalloprotease [Peptococcaceae bacterium]|nr:CPBP family intramembrane metalloprotease [Peptococcaceae bacterium]